MHASKRVVTVDRHEWTLPCPAHHTEVDKAMATANQERNALASRGTRTGDVYVAGGDDLVVISFEVERPSIVLDAGVLRTVGAADA
ncbi:hypothetical protein ACIOWI_29605 [Streptomyces sp. NPDC087659]|uniref:hypothetical protein n=1 Tax=Streptomyces sp. NPDC087659 TaxID=3365801 RepID=UPI003804D3F3